MKYSCLLLLFLAVIGCANGQSIDKIINPAEVQRIETILSSDEMKGRKAFTQSAIKRRILLATSLKKLAWEH